MTPRYEGRCHCGAVRWSLETEAITRGLRCNCSICVRRGAVMSVPYFALEVAGIETCTKYRWGDGDVDHYSCATCGIYVFHELVRAPGKYRINLGCLEGFDPLAVEIELVDGRSF